MLDQGALIRSGMAIVPDFAAQEAQRRLMAIQESQAAVQQQNAATAAAKQAKAIGDAAAYQRDLAGVMSNPTPTAIAGLQARYPDQSEGLKRAWDTMDAAQRGTDIRHMGEMFSAVRSGRPEVAAGVLSRRMEAERAAGMTVDPEDEAMLADLRSGDPDALKAAQGRIGMLLSAVDPDKFGSTYGALNPKSDPTNTEQVADFIGREQGPEARGRYISTVSDPTITVPLPGGRTYIGPRSGLPGVGSAPATQTEGGGPPSSGGGGGSTLAAMIPITSFTESGDRDFASGGGFLTSPKGARGRMQVMPGTQTDPGYGVRPAANNSADELARVGRDYLGAMHGRYEGDPAKTWAAYNAGPGRLDAELKKGGDWLRRMPAETRSYVARNMVRLRKGVGGVPDATGAVRVTSRQAYERLPNGTAYIAPDGSHRVKG